MDRAGWTVQPGGVRGLPGGSGVSGGVVRMSGGTQVTGEEEGPSRPASGAKAGRTEEVKRSSRVRVPENSRNRTAHWLYAGEGNGNPLQYSYLENPKDRGAWWVAVHGVAQSQT